MKRRGFLVTAALAVAGIATGSLHLFQPKKHPAESWLLESLNGSPGGIYVLYYPAGDAEAQSMCMRSAESLSKSVGRCSLLIPVPASTKRVMGIDFIERSPAGAAILKNILRHHDA